MKEAFHRIQINTQELWLAERKKRIQASDAAVVIGVSPWKTITQLYDEKQGLIEEKDISDKSYVQYGKAMEPLIRAQFLLDLPYFEVEYHEYDILVNNERPWQACTLDGELIVVKPNPWSIPIGTRGILECKTGQWKSYGELQRWIDFPPYYYAQQCHQLAVTGWSFNISASRIKRDGFKDEDNHLPEIRTLYHMVNILNDYEDIQYITDEESHFYNYNLMQCIRPVFELSR